MPAHEELLLDLIRDAFGDVALGDGISLHEARAIDNYCTLEKRREARAKDTEESWQQIPDAVIEEHYDIFPFLDAKGFRYLLPAYMCWTVRYLKKSQSCTSEFIVYALMPRCWLAEEGEKNVLFEQLTDKQRRAVAQFLIWKEKEDGPLNAEDAREALDEYWDQYST